MTLQGKRVLITGATGGLGMATTKALHKKGANVIGIDKKLGEAAGDEVIIADIRNPAVVKDAVAQAIDRLRGLDILINNAGVLSLQDPGAELSEDGDMTEALEVNLLGVWRVTSAALPTLLESRGQVIVISSLFAVVNAPYIPAYCASKRAVTAYSDVLRMQYGDRIRVTTLYPGYMRTPIHNDAERQGLSVDRIVTFRVGNRKLLSLEEPLDKAAQGVLRACSGFPMRDRGLTVNGTATLIFARYVPVLVDAFVKWRLGRLMKAGMKIVLD